jgi:hypothetical protein
LCWIVVVQFDIAFVQRNIWISFFFM